MHQHIISLLREFTLLNPNSARLFGSVIDSKMVQPRMVIYQPKQAPIRFAAF